jgi:hypothetical protein
MKKPLVLLSLIIFSVCTFGQTPKKTSVKFGETIRMTMKNYFFNMDIIGRDETGIYGIQLPAKEVYSGTVLGGIRNYHLARYDNETMTNPTLFEMEFKDSNGDREFEYAAQIGTEFYIFTSSQDRKQKKNFLWAQTVNKKQLSLNNDLKKIAEVDYSNESRHDRATFAFRFSRDKSKIMIRYNLLNSDNEVLRFGLCVMEKNFQKIWQNDGMVPVKEGMIFNFKKFYVDNKGDVYLLGVLFQSEKDLALTNNMRKKSFLSSKRVVQRQPNYIYQVISYTNKGKTLSDYVIQEPGKFITDMQIGVNEKQDIILTGFYADEGTVSVRGSYYFQINKGAKTVGKKTFEPFNNEFILLNVQEKEAKEILEDMAEGDEFDKYQYAMDDLQFNENGTISMVAEQFMEESKTVRSGNYVGTEYRYYDDNIIVVNFKADGSVAWKQKVQKSQYTESVNRVYAGFASLASKNKLYFVFNEFPDGRPNKSKAVMVEVGADGKISKEELFNAEEKKLVQPLTFKRTGDKEMTMFGLVKRNYSLARLNFD